MHQVYTQNSQSLLLPDCFPIQHPDMNQHLRGIRPRLILKPDPHPAIPRFAAGCHRVRKGEKRHLVPALIIQPLNQQVVFVRQHRLEPSPAHIPVGWPVDRVTDRHVVGRDRLGNRSCGAAHTEKPAGHFLPGPDLGKNAVALCVEIDLQRLLICVQCFIRHNPPTIHQLPSRRNPKTSIREADIFTTDKTG